MQEVTQDVMQVIEDLQMARYKRKQNGIGEADKDRYGYPFEPDSAFSSNPLEFVETALRLDIEALEMFSELSRLNRFSPLYYQLSGQFEKLIRQLGSCCITKAMIEQQENETFELLQDLTIEKLRRMTAFNFRKCFAAFMDSRSRGNCCSDAFAFSIRWSALDKRLIATEEKIGRIRRQELPEPMGTVPDGCEVSRKGLSPLDQPPVTPLGTGTLDQLHVSPLGTGPVGTNGLQQVQSPMALAEKGRALPVFKVQKSGSGNQDPVVSTQKQPAAGTQLPEPIGTVPDGCEVSRRGLSPLDQPPVTPLGTGTFDQLHVSPLGTGPVGTSVCQQVQSPMALDLLQRDAANGFRFLEKIGLLGDDPPEEEEWDEESFLPDLAVT